MKLTVEEYSVLEKFAKENGRAWKSKLRQAWMYASYSDFGAANYASALQQLRNSAGFGPSGLIRFSLTKHRPDVFTELSVGRRVVCLTGMYSPQLEGAVGVITASFPDENEYTVEFSSARQYDFRADQIRLATDDEIADDADLDKQFSGHPHCAE